MACFCHPRGVTAGITCMTESSDHSMVHFKNWHELNKVKLLPVHHQGDQWAACQCPCCCLPMVGTTKHVLICFPFVTMCFSVFNFCLMILMCSISFVFTNSQTELCNCYHVAPLHLQQILAAQTSVIECRVCMANLARFQSLPTTRNPLWERPGRHRQGKHRPIIRTGKKKCLNCKPAVHTWLFATPAHKVQRSNLRYCSMPKKLGFPSWAEIYRNNASQTNQMPDACASEEFGNWCCDQISWTCDNIHQHWTNIETNIKTYKRNNIPTYQHSNIQTLKHWNIPNFGTSRAPEFIIRWSMYNSTIPFWWKLYLGWTTSICRCRLQCIAVQWLGAVCAWNNGHRCVFNSNNFSTTIWGQLPKQQIIFV